MQHFLDHPPAQRAAAFTETAARLQLHPTPIEKDFWVCWLLRELFTLPSIRDHLIFKGGTSLSKGYGLIKRFSEDIDLSIDASVFGVEIESDRTTLSASQRDNRIKRIYRAAREFIDRSVLPELRSQLSHQLPDQTWNLELAEVKKDFHSLLFHYPKVLADSAQLRYARPAVLIELSARAEHEPIETREIQSYVAEEFPSLFTVASTRVKILSPRRTFWEKVTLLHAAFASPAEQSLPARLARHVYDLHQLLQDKTGQAAMPDRALFEQVCRHKAFFYPQTHVDYAAVQSGHLLLSPSPARRTELKRDYEAMRDFFMSKPPEFSQLMTSLQQIERQANDRL